MAENIELKLSVPNLAAVRKKAESVCGNTQPKLLVQTDFYYKIPKKRLKLRLIQGKNPELILYSRADVAGPRGSEYTLFSVQKPKLLHRMLLSKFGLRAVVAKKRHLLMYENTRIHLDEVAKLGTFVEFEYVVGPNFPREKGADTIAFLLRELGLESASVCSQSYVDLMEGRKKARSISE